ncbi:MAG: flagellar protein FlaG [Bordetella sp.]|nr:flagellar protein FlaG [Bordetella sp.]
MADNVASISKVAIHLDPLATAVAPIQAVRNAPDATEDASRYRLTIEREGAAYVYKILDRVTGEVVRQLPREEILKLRQSPTYDAGKIIKTGA